MKQAYWGLCTVDINCIFLKIADGKPANKFAFNARAKNKNFTLNVLRETHQQWCSLMVSKKEGLIFNRTHTTNLRMNKKTMIGQDVAKHIVKQFEESGPEQPISNNRVELWHHIPIF